MKQTILRSAGVLLFASSCALAACSDDDAKTGDGPDVRTARSALPRDLSPNVSAEDQAELVRGNTAFAIDLYQTLRKEAPAESLFLSPHSISTALAMTYAGARGATETEMASTLHFTLPQDRLHPAFDWLDLALESRGKGATGKDGQPFRLRVTNSTWGQEDMPFEQPFLDRLAVSYGAGVNLVDFRANADGARTTINAWVEEETETRIKDLIPAGKLTSDTRMVLVNAVYFNAAWQKAFEKSATADAPFTKLDGTTTTVSMMNAPALEARYVHGAGYDAVAVPYDGSEMSMVLVVPEAGSFAAFEDGLTGESFAAILGALAPETVKLGMPKFRQEGSFGLKAPLQALGMRAAFGGADFSGITTAESLSVEDVLHKTFLDIDESGTEAAAATAVIVTRESASIPSVTLTIDRPFFLAIVDDATKAPIFVGRVLDPKK